MYLAVGAAASRPNRSLTLQHRLLRRRFDIDHHHCGQHFAAKEVSSSTLIGSYLPSRSSTFRFHAAKRPHSALVGVLAAVRPQNGSKNKALLGNPSVRKVGRVPLKALVASCLKKDFYLNLVDWSVGSVLAFALGNCVYLLSAYTSVMMTLRELKFDGPNYNVSWNNTRERLAVGTSAGHVQCGTPSPGILYTNWRGTLGVSAASREAWSCYRTENATLVSSIVPTVYKAVPFLVRLIIIGFLLCFRE